MQRESMTTDPLSNIIMNQATAIEEQNPEPVALEQDFDKFSKSFIEREDSLILVGQLNQLVKAVQRHRGISMGMLGGNNEFQVEFQKLQVQLERRLATLEAFAKASQLLSERDKENLSFAWATIRSDWEGDNLNDNFELHSHFIQQLLTMIVDLAKKLEIPVLAPIAFEGDERASSGAFSQARMLQQIEILSFACKELPMMIEEIARIRGTAAYGAAVGSMEGLDERKIRYWISTLREHGENVRTQAEKLALEFGGQLSKLGMMKQNEIHLLQFLNTVESALFLGKGGRDEAHRLFVMATEVIEVYWDIVREGLGLLQSWHRQDLEEWIKLG